MQSLNRMLQKLIEGKVEFVLVGGYAAVAHGASLMTRDLDVCSPSSVENLRRLSAVLEDVHPLHRMTPTPGG
jgi:hypothetical protein